jgi:hypothetical protein
MQYGSYLSHSCINVFTSTAKTHYIRLLPVFLPDGKLVNTAELPVQLENAVIEMMFSLKHYYYGPTAGKFEQGQVENMFMGTIKQITILQANTFTSSSI